MKKILPFIGLLGTATTVVPITVSCAKEETELPTLTCTSDKIFTTDASGEYTLNFTYSGSNMLGAVAYAVVSDEAESYEPRIIIEGGTPTEEHKFSFSIIINDEVGTNVPFNLRILILLDNDECQWYEQQGFVGTIGE